MTDLPARTHLDGASVAERIRHLIEMSGSSQAHFGRRIGLDPSNLSKHLSGRLPVTEGLINRIVVDMGVSKQWLRDGIGLPFAKPMHALVANSQGDLAQPADEAHARVPIYDIDVTAGSEELSQMLTSDRIMGHIELPRLNPADLIVHVSGDSMTPVIRDGAYIAIRPVSDPRIIFWGQIYVVVLDDYRMVKYLRRCPDSESRVILRSANENYDDIVIDRHDIRNLFIVDAIFNFQILN